MAQHRHVLGHLQQQPRPSLGPVHTHRHHSSIYDVTRTWGAGIVSSYLPIVSHVQIGANAIFTNK